MPRAKKKTSGRKGRLQTHDSLGRRLLEKKIQNSILRWLKTQGIFHWRQNAGELHRGRVNVYLGPGGISDIVIILPPNGRTLFMEVKTPAGSQNPKQEQWQKDVEALGAYYVVVHSLQEAKECICMLRSGSLALSKGMKSVEPLPLDPWS